MTPSPAAMRLILTEARTALRGSHPTDVAPEPRPVSPTGALVTNGVTYSDVLVTGSGATPPS